MAHIRWCGIGLQGAPRVLRLGDAGFSLTLGNRTRGKAQRFADRARIAASAAQAVAEADVVITMLENGDVVESMLVEQGAMSTLKAGAVLVDMSSVKPSLARRHAALAAGQGAGYLDAPVSGGTRGADAGSLALMAGGNGDDPGQAKHARHTT